jgi:hypothetical protein
MDIIKCFNENKRQQLWDKNQNHYKKWFRRALEQLKLDIQLNLTDKDLALYTYRLSIGYWGIGKGNGIPSGIRSTATQNLKSNQTTNDHLFGVVEVGRYVHQELIKMNMDVDRMVNEWLYDNLWLWITIKVSKTEHKSENIARNKHSLDDKKQLKHYKNVSELILA